MILCVGSLYRRMQSYAGAARCWRWQPMAERHLCCAHPRGGTLFALSAMLNLGGKIPPTTHRVVTWWQARPTDDPSPAARCAFCDQLTRGLRHWKTLDIVGAYLE